MKTDRLPSKGLVTACLVVIALMIGIGVASRASAYNPERSKGEHLITLYDRGVERSFVTSAATVRGALEEAKIEVDDRDRVEPSIDESLVAETYTINIYRSRPVTVIDGSLRKMITTAAQTPEQIAKDADIRLYPEDMVSMKQPDNMLSDGVAEQFIVRRATAFTMTLYDKTVVMRTQASTVGGMLHEKGIQLGESDRASLPLDTLITAGMQLRVWREGQQTSTVEEEVDFETEVISDANRPVGYKEVTTPGQKGKRSVTYEIVIQDGREIVRTEITSVIITLAVKQVEVQGAKPEAMPYTGGGTKTEWLAASNISAENWGYADWLVTKESGWNPNAVNRSSGACGLAQALPCSKVGSDPYNPVVSLNWMNGYVIGRYGSWANAVAHSKTKGWY